MMMKNKMRTDILKFISLAFLALGLGACADFHGGPWSFFGSSGFTPIPIEVPRGLLMEDPIAYIKPLSQDPLLDWPVDKARLTRGFLPYGKPRPHLGLDLAAPRGTPIFASQGGIVIYAGTGFSGYGRFVIIESESGWATFYGHLDKILVRTGQDIAQGQAIGKMGHSGRASGNHLHFELRQNKKAIDPLAFLPQGSSWVKQM